MALRINPDSFSRHVIPGAANLLSSFAEVAAADRAARAARQREERMRRYSLDDRAASESFQSKERLAREQAAKDDANVRYQNNLSLQEKAAEKVRLMNAQSIIDGQSLGLLDIDPGADPEAPPMALSGAVGLDGYMDALRTRQTMDLNSERALKVQTENEMMKAKLDYFNQHGHMPGVEKSGGKGAGADKVGYSADAARSRKDAESAAYAAALQFPARSGFQVDEQGEIVLDDDGKPVVSDPASNAAFIAQNRDTRLREQGIDPDTMEFMPVPDGSWHAPARPVPVAPPAFGAPVPMAAPPNLLMDNWQAPAGYVPQAQKRTMAQIQASVQRANAAGQPITLEQAIAKAQAAGVHIIDLPGPVGDPFVPPMLDAPSL